MMFVFKVAVGVFLGLVLFRHFFIVIACIGGFWAVAVVYNTLGPAIARWLTKPGKSDLTAEQKQEISRQVDRVSHEE